MATSRPTFDDKVDRITQEGDRINLVIADDINQLKRGVIALYNMVKNANIRTCISISPTDFAGSNYQNSLLINLIADVDFRVFTNEGSGTLLRWDDEGYDKEGGYSYAPSTGTLTMPIQSYSLEIYTPIPEL